MHRAGEIPPSTSSGSNGPVKLEAMRFTQALERVLCTKYAPGQLLTALPIGLSEGCVLLRDISKGDVISFPPTQPSLFEQAKLAGSIRSIYAHVRDFKRLKAAVAECRADVVIHMAAQSVVRPGYEDPIETYSSNVMGTVHILEALRQLKQPCVVVADSVYGLNIPGANITRSHVGRGGGLTIGIAPMAYCGPRRYWDKDKAVYECFIRKLAEFSAGLIRD